MRRSNANEIMRRLGGALLSAAAVTMVAGCANMTSIYRTFDIGTDASKDGKSARSEGVLIDAQQRAIMKSPVRGPKGRAEGEPPIICAEPSPDAISAFSASVAASASIPGVNTEADKAAASLAYGSAIAALQRGSTVQLLRDGLYRACEGYMNGSLTREEYVALFHKFADASVTLLAVESMSGRGVISGPGAGAASSASAEAKIAGGGSAAPKEKDGSSPASSAGDEGRWTLISDGGEKKRPPASGGEMPDEGEEAKRPPTSTAQGEVVREYFANNKEREKATRIAKCMSYVEERDSEGAGGTEAYFLERKGLQFLFCAQNFEGLEKIITDQQMQAKLRELFQVYIDRIKQTPSPGSVAKSGR